jgi:hypothetical protein
MSDSGATLEQPKHVDLTIHITYLHLEALPENYSEIGKRAWFVQYH